MTRVVTEMFGVQEVKEFDNFTDAWTFANSPSVRPFVVIVR